MKIKHSCLLLSFTAAFTLSQSHALADSVITNENLPYDVPFELGSSNFGPGDNITITEVRGTSDKIEVGGTYSVEGTYTLSSKDHADLSFFATSIGYSAPTPIDPNQTMRITNGTGSFYLVKTMTEDGYLHVSFYAGEGFGGVYFGQGDRVYHDTLRYSHSNTSGNSTNDPPSSSDPNQTLFNYLGNPVMPPPNMDQRYSATGLASAVQQAAQNAGITVKSITVDDSEFPFLIGVICGGSDAVKLKNELRQMPGYEYGGGVGDDSNSDGSDTCNVFCIVPSSAFHQGTAYRIYRRLMVREAMFHDRISNRM